MQSWTKEEVELLANNLHKSTKDLYLSFCENFGEDRSYDSIQKKIKNLREAHTLAPDDFDSELDIQESIDHLLQEEGHHHSLVINSVPAEIKKERKEAAKIWLEGIADLSDDMKDQIYTINKKTNTGNKTSLCVVFSDTHFGKHTKWFDLATAKKRMTEIPSLLRAKPFPEIDEVVILLVGDMIEGEDIYPTQNSHIECSALEQVQVCSEAIWQMVLGFRELFKCAVRVETVPGNHGRVSKTANEKTNWDNVIYHIVRLLSVMHKDPEIQVNCNFEPFKTFKVKDKVGMLYHHGVQHTGTASMRVKVAGWTSTKNFDFLCFEEGTKAICSDGTTINIENIVEGQKLMGQHGPTIVEKVHPIRKVNEPIFTLKVEGLPQELITGVTGEHPFYSISGMTCIHPSRNTRSCHLSKEKESSPCDNCNNSPIPTADWVMTSDLKKGDYIGIPVPKIPENAIHNPRLAKLLGFFLAEGHFMKQELKKSSRTYTGVAFSFHEKETEYHKEVKDIFKEFFNEDMYLYKQDTLNNPSKGIQLSKTNYEAADFFFTNAGEYADKKKISSWAWNLDKESRLALLSGWLFGDSHIESKLTQNRLRNRIEATTVSSDLATQMYLLALSCDLEPTYRIGKLRQKKENSEFYKQTHLISFYGKSCKTLFEFNNLDYVETEKTKVLGFFHEGLYYRKLEEITSTIKDTTVYNIRTSTSEYIAGLLSSHNCHGHWHEWHVGNWLGKFVIGNGCMCGPDDLAERMGVEDEARQAYFLVTPNQPLWGFSFVEWPRNNE